MGKVEILEKVKQVVLDELNKIEDYVASNKLNTLFTDDEVGEVLPQLLEDGWTQELFAYTLLKIYNSEYITKLVEEEKLGDEESRFIKELLLELNPVLTQLQILTLFTLRDLFIGNVLNLLNKYLEKIMQEPENMNNILRDFAEDVKKEVIDKVSKELSNVIKSVKVE